MLCSSQAAPGRGLSSSPPGSRVRAARERPVRCGAGSGRAARACGVAPRPRQGSCPGSRVRAGAGQPGSVCGWAWPGLSRVRRRRREGQKLVERVPANRAADHDLDPPRPEHATLDPPQLFTQLTLLRPIQTLAQGATEGNLQLSVAHDDLVEVVDRDQARLILTPPLSDQGRPPQGVIVPGRQLVLVLKESGQAADFQDSTDHLGPDSRRSRARPSPWDGPRRPRRGTARGRRGAGRPGARCPSAAGS